MKTLAVSPELMVKDVPTSLKFYENLFDTKAVATEQEMGELVWAKIVLREGASLTFKAEKKLREEYEFFAKKAIGASLSLCFFIENIKEFYKSLPQKIEVVNELHRTACNLNEFSIFDPDNYVLTFIEE